MSFERLLRIRIHQQSHGPSQLWFSKVSRNHWIHRHSPTGVTPIWIFGSNQERAGPQIRASKGGTFGAEPIHLSVREVRTHFCRFPHGFQQLVRLKSDSGGFHVRVCMYAHTHVCKLNSIVGSSESSDRHLRICTKNLTHSYIHSWKNKNRASGSLAVLLDPLAVGYVPNFSESIWRHQKFQVNLCFWVLAGLQPESSDDQFLQAAYSVTRTIHAALGTIRISIGW